MRAERQCWPAWFEKLLWAWTDRHPRPGWDTALACRIQSLSSGPLKPAIASTIAVPGLMKPVLLGERVLVDGAAVNPLPFDLLRGKADIVIAVDASVGPLEPGTVPDPWEALFATMHVIAHGIVNRKLSEAEPDLLLQPNLAAFRLFDFFRASAILRAAEPIKAEFREKLTALL